MKKILILFLSFINAFSAYSYTLVLDAGGFYKNDGTELDDIYFAVLVAKTGTSFSDSFTLSAGTEVKAGSTIEESYYVLSNSILSDGTGSASLTLDNNALGFVGGEEIGIIAWTSPSNNYTTYLVEESASYTWFNPKKANGDTSGYDAWVIPASNEGDYVLQMVTVGFGGTVPNSAATLNQTVVPEPSAVAAFMAFAAFAIVMARRRK